MFRELKTGYVKNIFPFSHVRDGAYANDAAWPQGSIRKVGIIFFTDISGVDPDEQCRQT